MKAANWGEFLQGCRAQFGPAPRQLNKQDQSYFRLQASLLMRLLLRLRGDKLQLVLNDHHYLRDDGRVVWGQLVQANELLFSPTNSQTLPANVLYSPDTYFDDHVPLLQDVASKISQLKGTSPGDEELRQFAQAVTDELARTMRLPLPRSLVEGKDVFFTTCFVEPTHLPGGYLTRNFFPLLICPEKTEAVMILPARYWPKELRAYWARAE